MPATTNVSEDFDPVDRPPDRLTRMVRARLLAVGLSLSAVFVAAAWIRPYDEDGRALRRSSHTQLGLSPCDFERKSGKPCPSCGMTTSFALLMRGDVANSLRANWAGTMMAMSGLLVVPWALVSAWRGRAWLVEPRERGVLWIVGGFAVLAVLRWAALMLSPSVFG